MLLVSGEGLLHACISSFLYKIYKNYMSPSCNDVMIPPVWRRHCLTRENEFMSSGKPPCNVLFYMDSHIVEKNKIIMDAVILKFF